MQPFQGAVALVTGGSRGLGRAIALKLAQKGADVAVNYRAAAAQAAAVAAEIAALGRRAVTVQADVSRVDEARRLVAAAAAALGPITILVNNAGIVRLQSPGDITEQDWDELMSVNLKSAFFVSQAVLPGMLAAGWGRILNLSSTAAHTGGAAGAHYAASKAGLIGLTHHLAARVAKQGITVNAIAPALIETDMISTDMGNADLRAMSDRIPVGRLGTAEELAQLAVALAQNGYVTGQTVSANGGLYMT
jgi:3-oxoacyl-[acyl-carrier protein] reductase